MSNKLRLGPRGIIGPIKLLDNIKETTQWGTQWYGWVKVKGSLLSVLSMDSCKLNNV